MSQRVTQEMARNKMLHRHWVARFQRKAMGVFKGVERVDLTMGL